MHALRAGVCEIIICACIACLFIRVLCYGVILANHPLASPPHHEINAESKKKHDICINPNGYTAQSYLIFPRFRAMNIGCVESDPCILMLHLRLHQDALLSRHIYRRAWWRSGSGGDWPLWVLPIIILTFSLNFFLVVFPGPLLPLTANRYFTENHLKFIRIANHNRDWQETFSVRRNYAFRLNFFFNYRDGLHLE